jgi:hypothetical protein
MGQLIEETLGSVDIHFSMETSSASFYRAIPALLTRELA